MKLRLALIVLFLAAPAAAEPGARVVEYGRYESISAGTIEKAERTVQGEVRPVATKKLLERTDTIVGQIGNSFGIEIDLDGLPSGTIMLTIRTLHPPLKNPETGRVMTSSEFDWPVAARQGVYFGFSFDHRWEIAEGEWAKQILYKGRLLAEKKFKVVVPLN